MKSKKPLNLNLKRIRISHPFTASNAWWLSLAGCIVVTGILLLGNLYTEQRIIDSRVHIVFQAALNLVLFLLLFVFNFTIMKKEWPRQKILLVSGFGSLAITLGCTCLSQAVRILIYREALANGYLGFDIIKDLVVASTAFLISVLLSDVTHHHQTEIENEHLRAENLLIRYQSLENQVEPHFLFNSLNTLDGLIGLDDPKAHEYLHLLASSYRYIMRQQKHVTLADELSFADTYIGMMQMRYGANLVVEKQILTECLTAEVVPISLQLLLENAVKHNVISDRHPLHITISTPDPHTLQVANTLQPKNDQEQSDGIGLSNLNQRCMLLFGKTILISQSDTQFSVSIPLAERNMQ